MSISMCMKLTVIIQSKYTYYTTIQLGMMLTHLRGQCTGSLCSVLF